MTHFIVLSIYRGFVSAVVIAIGIFVVKKNKDSIPSKLFFLFCLTNGLGILSLNSFEMLMMFFKYHSAIALYCQIFFGSIGALLWVLFARAYATPSRKSNSKWQYLLYLPTLFFILAPIKYSFFNSIFIENNTLYKNRTIAYFLFIIYSLLCVFVANIILWIKFRQAKNVMQKNQIKLLVIGGCLGGCIVITDFLLAYLGHVFHLMHIGFLTFVFFSAYSILKHRAFDIKSAFHFGLFWAISRVIFLSPVIFLPHLFLSQFEFLELKTPLVLGGYGILSLLYFFLCQKIFFLNIDRYLLKRKLRLEKASIRFAEDLYAIRSQNELLQVVFNYITLNLFTSEVLFFIPESIPNKFLRISSQKSSFSNQTIQFSDKMPQIIFGENLTKYLPEELIEEDIKVINKIYDEVLLGFLCLKEKKNYSQYTEQEIEFISVISRTMAMALKGIRFHHTNLELNTSLVNANRARLFLKEAFDGVSHELKTAFYSSAGIKNMVLNREVKGEEELRRIYLETISFGEYIFHMVRNYGVSEKIESGNISVSPSSILFKEILDMAIKLNDYYVQDKSIEITVCGDSNIEVYLDKEKLITVLSNAINNAIKYSHDNSSIKICLETKDQTLIVLVQDFGIGIPKCLLDKIFDKTQNQKVTRGNNYFSLGLGLPLSKALIELIQGQIEIISEEHIGTTVRIVIPLSYDLSKVENYVE